MIIDILRFIVYRVIYIYIIIYVRFLKFQGADKNKVDFFLYLN